jgi:hypothetical protein
MANEQPERTDTAADVEIEKETGDIRDDAEVTASEAQAESGTVEGQVPGTKSRIEKPPKEDRDSNG